MSDLTTLEGVRDQLKEWIWRGKFASTANFSLDIEEGRQAVTLRFKTTLHTYSIVGRPHGAPVGGRLGYLGCVVSNRHPRPGETWTRGSDLADGDLSEGTWDRIVQDILSVELAAAAEVEV